MRGYSDIDGILREHGVAAAAIDEHSRAPRKHITIPERNIIICEEPTGYLTICVRSGYRDAGEQMAGWFPELDVLVVEDDEFFIGYEDA